MSKHGKYYYEGLFSIKDFWWLIGLLEGEGSFIKANPNYRPNSPRVSLAMTDEDTISRAAIILGLKYSNRLPKNGRKRIFSVDMRGTRAFELMKLICPCMSARRQIQIKLAIATYKPKQYRRGENHPNSYLSENDVIEIKGLLADGISTTDIATIFEVTQACIWAIDRGKTWRHVELSSL